MGRAADDAVRADGRARLGGRLVVLADVHSVGAARVHEVGAVVEDEQRPALAGGAAERRRRLDQLLAAEVLVAELDDVDAAAQRRREQGRRVLAVGARLADEVQARRAEPLDTRSVGRPVGHLDQYREAPALHRSPRAPSGPSTMRLGTGAHREAERAASRPPTV